eukprot:GHVS01038907.1.p2 GENE.GHVS01038907.1~~GHVS01038907.1.p2  ORF type:complete len:108 (-),score=0.84 GHVS01038907.1:379-702(-)
MTCFAISKRDHKGMWNAVRHLFPLAPLGTAVAITGLARVAPHEAVYSIATAFTAIHLIDILSHRYSLSPPWLARHRGRVIWCIIGSLALLVTSEAQVFIGRKLVLKE